MTKRTIIILSLLLLLVPVSVARADQLEKGDVELQFRLSYSDLDFDGPGGDSNATELVGIVGYMLTDHHQVGAGLAYGKSGSSDSVEYGARYTYNFRAGTNLNPYAAALILGFGGDRGDVFDLGYAVEGGVKVYPWANGGMLFGLSYRQLKGSDRGLDATNFISFGGLILKF